MTSTDTSQIELERKAIDVVRGLAMDGPNAARSGHQGTAMALAPVAHVLWTRIMRYDPGTPDWPDRDRFVLSCGHASILLYSMLHLTGYDVSLDDLRDFRQWASATPGHPEAGHTPGVEVTTGPLGQGFANGVGLGLAERSMRARFGAELCDHHTFVLCSDGDLAEGVSHEAASLAGHLGLGRLIAIYDDNHISIDGPTGMWLSDDPAARFVAYGWHVQSIGAAGEDLDAIEGAVRDAMAVEDRPSIIIVNTEIGTPSPDHTGDAAAHGYAIFDDEIARTKQAMGLPADETFWVPDDVATFYRAAAERGRAARVAWEKRLETFAGDRDAYRVSLAGTGVDGWADALPSYEPGESIATRKASGACLAALADVVPGLVSGGADLTGNTGTAIPGATAQSASDPGGRQIYFGVREHAMGSALVGMALHGGVVPVGGTFLVFSDYMRPAVRLAALSGAKAIFVWTHDSVGVGEDGPTHQPVEQLAALRAIPGLTVIRPADANETVAAWRIAIDNDGPTAIILTRQNVPVLEGTGGGAVDRGGYIVTDVTDPAIVLAGTGSEVSVCVAASELLAADGIAARVVSLPCWSRFDAEDAAYRSQVLGDGIPVLGVEAAVSLGWYRYADDVVSIERFGASAPGDVVMEELGIEPVNVSDHARRLLAARKRES